MSGWCVCIEPNRGDTTKKQKSRWELVMKEFSQKRKEKCKGEDAVTAPSKHITKDFPTGSSYEGAYEDMNMRGYGEYTFPNGVLYRGEFESGMCHGDGELVYENGPKDFVVIRGKWKKGIMKKSKILFSGILEYNAEDWRYCKMPDRRYSMEFNKELKPAGQSNITAEQPPREIPPGFLDNGYGFYNPTTKVVYRYQNILEVAKAASQREQEWIVENCRMNPVGTIGPRPDFYETWLGPEPDPPPLPKLLVGFEPTNVRSTFKLEDEEEEKNMKTAFYDSSNVEFKRPRRKFQRAQK